MLPMLVLHTGPLRRITTSCDSWRSTFLWTVFIECSRIRTRTRVGNPGDDALTEDLHVEEENWQHGGCETVRALYAFFYQSMT